MTIAYDSGSVYEDSFHEVLSASMANEPDPFKALPGETPSDKVLRRFPLLDQEMPSYDATPKTYGDTDYIPPKTPFNWEDYLRKTDPQVINPEPQGSPISPQIQPQRMMATDLSAQSKESDPFEAAAQRIRQSVVGGREQGALTKYPEHVVESMVTLPKRAFEAAEKLATTGEYDPGPALETAFMMAGARTPFLKPGEVGLFGGRMTEQAVKSAEFLENQGISEAGIKSLTGLERGAEGKWRREFSDAKAELNLEGPSKEYTIPIKDEAGNITGDQTVKGAKLGDILKHDELFATYPEIAELPVISMKKVSGNENTKGAFNRSGDNWFITLKEGMTEEKTKSTLLHEIQHWIQHREGFATGNISHLEASVKEALVARIRHEFGPSLLTAPEHQVYRRLANEVEARNVQARMDLSPEEIKAITAKETEDIPRGSQLVMSPDKKVVYQGTEFYVDPEVKQEAVKLLRKGHTYQDVANQLDIERNQVAGIANREGIKSKNPQGFQSEDNPAKQPRYGKKGSVGTRSVFDKNY